MDRAFLETQIADTKTLITAYNAAILALIVDGAQSYTIDTGQSRQVVTKLNLRTLKTTRTELMNELSTLEARLNGSGSMTGRPDW